MLPSKEARSSRISVRPVSDTTMPTPVDGSKILTTPCMNAECSGGKVGRNCEQFVGRCPRDTCHALSSRRLGLVDFAGFQTRGADTRSASVGAVADADALDIGKPTSAGAFVRETDLLPEPRLFSTDFTTIGHGDLLGPVSEISTASQLR